MARKPTDKQLFKMKNEWLGQFYEEVWSPTTFASGLTEMTRQQKHKLSGLTTHSFFM